MTCIDCKIRQNSGKCLWHTLSGFLDSVLFSYFGIALSTLFMGYILGGVAGIPLAFAIVFCLGLFCLVFIAAKYLTSKEKYFRAGTQKAMLEMRRMK